MRPVGAFNEPVRAPIMKLLFSRRHVESTPFHPKTKLGFCLMFWSASKTGAKTCPVGLLNAPVRAPITKLVFSRQTGPIHTTASKNQVWVCIAFLVTCKNSAKMRPVGALNASVRAPITKLVFSRQTCRIHSVTPKNQARVLSHVLVSFKNRQENVPRRCFK